MLLVTYAAIYNQKAFQVSGLCYANVYNEIQYYTAGNLHTLLSLFTTLTIGIVFVMLSNTPGLIIKLYMFDNEIIKVYMLQYI